MLPVLNGLSRIACSPYLIPAIDRAASLGDVA